jgi:hypothetical protein
MEFHRMQNGSFFGCWGDLHLNYDFPKWVIAKKIDDSTAVEIYEDKSEHVRFSMSKNINVTYYYSWEQIEW